MDVDFRVLTGFKPRGEKPVRNLEFDLGFSDCHRISRIGIVNLVDESCGLTRSDSGFLSYSMGQDSDEAIDESYPSFGFWHICDYQTYRRELRFDSQLHLTDILQSREEVQISFPALIHSRSCLGDPDLSPFYSLSYSSLFAYFIVIIPFENQTKKKLLSFSFDLAFLFHTQQLIQIYSP